MKNKKWLLLLIIAFPSLFWLILETSTINSRHLPFYGPKTVTRPGDTLYYTVSSQFLFADTLKPAFKAPSEMLFTVCFLAQEYRKDAYRLTGLWEYLNYKKSKIAPLPVVLIAESSEKSGSVKKELASLDAHENVMLLEMEPGQFKKLRATYFNAKPYYIDYSFFVLVDSERHIRGFYDARYVSEIKRLLGEYQHLRLKDEKRQMLETNEIKSES